LCVLAVLSGGPAAQVDARGVRAVFVGQGDLRGAGRGGVCTGGYTEWCDATTLDEIEAAYEAGTLE
jgi:hypothetical protein